MQRRRRVALYGDSVVLTAVGASLKSRPALEVISLATSCGATPEDLDTLSPEVVLLDLGLVGADFAFALLRERPDLLLIGLDPGGDRLLVLSGRQARALTTEDLVWLIETRAAVPETDQPGDSEGQPWKEVSGAQQ